MSTKKLGIILLALGALTIFFSLTIDLVAAGDQRIGSSQLLGLQVGIVAAVLGISLLYFYPEVLFDLRERIRASAGQILNLPVGVWVVAGFLLTYILFLLFPMFLNEDRTIIYFNRYIPDKRPIGLDLSITMGSVIPWVQTGQSPYPQLFYPPLTYILFAPLALVNYPASYFLITFLTLASFITLAVLSAKFIPQGRDRSLLALVFFSGLLSYGFQFELERGQFNLITFLLCMLAIYIFHRHYEFRYLAYLLFSIAIQIKVYPAIFIFMFIKDWRVWKENIRRVVGLGLFNFALLFVLGYGNFLGFIEAVATQLRTPGWSWNGNHSIQAFVYNFLKDGYNLIPAETLSVWQQQAGSISLLLLVVILGCLFSIIIRAYLHNEAGVNPFVLLACSLVALTLPASNDYTLPVLLAPVSIFFCTFTWNENPRRKLLSLILILVTSIAYSSLLYPFKYKPYYLNNSFPALLVMLLAVTALYFLGNGAETSEQDREAKEVLS